MMRDVIIWIHPTVHFLADFLFGCKYREGDCLRTVHNSYRGGLGAAPPQWGNHIQIIRAVHKRSSDLVRKQRDWAGLAFKSNEKCMQVVLGLFTSLKVALKLWSFLLTQFFSNSFVESVYFLLWDGNERGQERRIFKMSEPGETR